MVGLGSRLRGLSRGAADEDDRQTGLDEAGRDLSDVTSPYYDPRRDPDLQLRVTRTAAESIHQVSLEDDRRRKRRLLSLKRDPTDTSPKERRSLFARATLRRKNNGTGSSIFGSPSKSAAGSPRFANPGSPDADDDDEDELHFASRPELQRQATQANAAAEAKESARRQDKQDGSSKGEGGLFSHRKKARQPRTVFVNLEGGATNPKGYERNKVKTTKYDLVTFVPKNLAEQFRRVANMYFLGIVILQVFPIFGAAAPQIGMLPLVFILCVTGLKDGIEDYRRYTLDNAVNNSAVTKLGDWRNVNEPVVKRRWYHVFGGAPVSGAVSKGVRKLREREGTYDASFLYANSGAAETRETLNASAMTLGNQSNYTVDHEYPPMNRSRSETLQSSTPSHRTKSDVVSYHHATPGTAKWERTLWKKLIVGDIVLLKENDQIPADIIVLSTSDPDGVCFVETKNLDGETNLKPRKAVRGTSGIANEEDIEHARFWVDSEAPHANLYSYNAALKYRVEGGILGHEHPVVEGKQLDMASEKQEGVTINEMLLRGCTLRNTTWVIGLVMYTGQDTKIMLNQGDTPSKRSKIEKETNFNVIVNFLILLGLCIVCAVVDGYYSGKDLTSATLYEAGAEISQYAYVDGLVTFGSCLIMFQNIVPISLVITVELVKTIQALFIYFDLDMWYEPLEHACIPKTWNISDDLGQIEYIFSDKTGTLTQNVMEFQKCAVGEFAYGDGITEAMVGAAKREGKDMTQFDPVTMAARLGKEKDDMLEIMGRMHTNHYRRDDKLTLVSKSLALDMNQPGPQQQRIIEFFRALAVCHTVMAEQIDESDPTRLEYKAESPDEAALVSAARDVGFAFVSRSQTEIVLETMGQREVYKPLRVLEFNSTRKRMSTIVRTPDNRILLICKGADSVIYQRLRADHDERLKQTTTKHLEDFANAGLRTLCISAKYITEEEFVKWSKGYDAACAALTDREEEIEKSCELIEHGLTILGASALEDKLQVGVPDAIAQLHKAGIKLWILTGDKLQTAIEIGFSCNLLSSEMEIMILSADSEEGARTQIEAGLDKLARAKAGLAPVESFNEKGERVAAKTAGFAVVIDGETLRHALEVRLKPMFLELTTQCETVVCCRVSPSQKALTVKLVKDGKNAMTLAIGDGANDVAMIQEAHIGVGIAGLEGAQASMSADYAVGQFRFLTKLLIVHGRWCYIRVADMHATFFYKNIVWTITLFLFQFFCNFDATYLYDYSLIMLFSIVFTSLPVAVLGIFDQDISAKAALAYPQLYERGIKGLEYTRWRFFIFMFDGLYQSCVVFFVPYFVFWLGASISPAGHDFAIWELGTTVAVAAVTAANNFVGLHIRYWTWMVFVIIICSTLAIHIWIIIYSQFETYTFTNLVSYLYATLPFWLSWVVAQPIAILPRFAYRYIRSVYFPEDNDIVRELQVLGDPSLRKSKGGLEMEEGRPASMASMFRNDLPLVTSTRPLSMPFPASFGGPIVVDDSGSARSVPRGSPEISYNRVVTSPDSAGSFGRSPPTTASFADSFELDDVSPRLQAFQQHGGPAIPTIRIEGTTPHASLHSRSESSPHGYEEEEEIGYAYSRDGHGHQARSNTSSANSSEDRHRRHAREETNDTVLTSASSHSRESFESARAF